MAPLPLRFMLTLLLASGTIAHGAAPGVNQHESFAPYWTAEPGWETELQLKNNLVASYLTVTPILRLANGREIPLSSVTVPSNAVVSVRVNEELTKVLSEAVEPALLFGSVAFRYTSNNAKNLYAAAMIHMHGRPIGYHVDAYPVYSGPLTGSREGIWWQPRPGVKDFLVMSNGSNKRVRGALSLFEAGGRKWGQILNFLPYETKRVSIGELIQTAKLHGNYGGIKLELPAYSAAIDTIHVLFEETAGFSAMMKMFDRDPAAKLERRSWAGNKHWTMWAPMLALQSPDPVIGFPPGTTLHPTIFLYNPTTQPVLAAVTLTWRDEAKRRKIGLPPIRIRPFETRQLEIGAMQKKLGIPDEAHWALVTLTSSAGPDSIVAVVESYDATLRYGAQTPFSDQLSHHWEGGEWRVDSTHNTIATVGNGGTKPAEALVTLHYDNGTAKYEILETIQPGDQLWLNLGELIHNNVPDSKGRKLPTDIESGTYDILHINPEPGGSLFEGKILLDKTFGHLAYGCGVCCYYDAVYLLPDPANIVGAGTQPLTTSGDNSCTGLRDNLHGYFVNGTWWSGDPSVATLTTFLAHGVAAGSTPGYARANLPHDGPKSCPLSPQTALNTVQVSPQITGPNTLWWFKGVSLGVSGYATKITLAASSGTTYQWSIVAGFDKVTLPGSNQNSTQEVDSIGQSGAANDVSINVTVNGVPSSPFRLTVKAPYALGTDPLQPTPVYMSDTNYVWRRDFYYRVLDNFLVPLPVSVNVNENWNNILVEDYVGTNWRQPVPNSLGCGSTNSTADFSDQIFGESSSRIPTPVYTSNWNGPKVQHWGQEWRIGACSTGYGPRVQTDTIQKFSDHAEINGITTPAP